MGGEGGQSLSRCNNRSSISLVLSLVLIILLNNYCRAFQLVEMQGHWDQHTDSNENNLIGYWKFDEISGKSSL